MNIYVISYKNEERKNRMIKRLTEIDYFRNVIFPEEVHNNDSRLSNLKKGRNDIDLRTWSIMLQHLDAVKMFLDTEDSYCVICEDDIHIHRKLKQKIPGLINVFQSCNLYVLMLGYLVPFKIDLQNDHHKKYFELIAEHQDLSYTRYPDDIWELKCI